jgi:Raf kinase inhibitor-like YbhB/YbcL family protein
MNLMSVKRVVLALVVCAAVAGAAAVDAQQRAGWNAQGAAHAHVAGVPRRRRRPATVHAGRREVRVPPLEWVNVPDNVVSFVLLLRDPDVALQRKVEDSLHWLIFNIPGSARGLPEGVQPIPRLPDGTVQAQNRRGIIGYLGPGAPPPGPRHHYTFELFALDMKLDLGPEATRAQVLSAIDGHILGKAVLVGPLPHVVRSCSSRAGIADPAPSRG